MNIKPLADRVVVKPVEVEETTSSGIILAASAPALKRLAPNGVSLCQGWRVLLPFQAFLP